VQLHQHRLAAGALTSRASLSYAAPMRLFACAAAFFCCAIASFGCGSTPPNNMDLYGAYNVMITAGTQVDSDVMNVVEGSNGSLLFTFEFGITTDANGPNANGLRASLNGDKVTLAAQPAHVDHWMGLMNGNISGSGSLKKGGDADLSLTFAPASGSPLTLAISGSKL